MSLFSSPPQPQASPAAAPVWSGYAWMLLFLRLLVGALFMIASLGKLHDPLAFAYAIGGFKLLHPSVQLDGALLISWMEIICAALLIIGVWVRAAALLTTGMLGMFLFVLASAVARGLDIDCGCFGGLLPEGVGMMALIRTLALLGMSWIVFLYGPGRLALQGLWQKGKQAE